MLTAERCSLPQSFSARSYYQEPSSLPNNPNHILTASTTSQELFSTRTHSHPYSILESTISIRNYWGTSCCRLVCMPLEGTEIVRPPWSRGLQKHILGAVHQGRQYLNISCFLKQTRVKKASRLGAKILPLCKYDSGLIHSRNFIITNLKYSSVLFASNSGNVVREEVDRNRCHRFD